MADDLNRFGNMFEDAYNQAEEFKNYFNNTLDEMERHFRQTIGAIGRELTEEENRQLRQQQENAERSFNSTLQRAERIRRRSRELQQEEDRARAELENARGSGDRERIRNAQERYRQASNNNEELDEATKQKNKTASKISKVTDTALGAIEGSGVTGLAWMGDLVTTGFGQIGKAVAGPIGEAVGKTLGKVGTYWFKKWAEYWSKLSKLLDQEISQASDTFRSYSSKVDTRLQGTSTTFKDIVTDLKERTQIQNTKTDELLTSALIDRKVYIDNIGKLTESGIAYNLEERAMLMTLSDKIATTFNALDQNLTRLIRLQQADLTATSLGSEASLTNFLNTYYNDTSYLGDKYSSVTSTLLEATSQMNTDQATSFAYAVQKWLGALYSVGLSGEAVDLIAKGLTYLSTGDISQLGSDTSLQTMMALASQKAGISYADLLTGGLDAENVDSLMTSMVNYLSAIANNTSNQVVKSEWSNIFGLSLSDLRAIANLTAEDIETLQGGNLGYQEAQNELQLQMLAAFNRTSVQEAIDTIINNLAFEHGMDIAMNDAEYWAWREEQWEKERAHSNVFTKAGFFLEDLFRAQDSNIKGDTTRLQESWDLFNMMRGTSAVMNTTFAFMQDWFPDLGFSVTQDQLDDAFRTMFGTDNPLAVYGLNLFNNWGGTQFNAKNRGSGFTGLSPIVTGAIADYFYENTQDTAQAIQRTVSSSNMGSTVTAAENIINSFDQTESAVQAQSEDIIGTNEEITETLDKLYNMLFEAQTTPIKVNIDTASDEFVELLTDILTNNTDKLSTDIESIITSSTDYAGSLMNSLNLVRGS